MIIKVYKDKKLMFLLFKIVLLNIKTFNNSQKLSIMSFIYSFD